MNVFSIDQSFTSSGFCIFIDGILTNHGIIKTEKSDRKNDIFLRAIHISDSVCGMIEAFSIDVLSIEGITFAKIGGNSNRDLAMLQGIIISDIIRKFPHVDIQIHAPTSVKKFATDNGKAKKEEMFESIPSDTKEAFEALYKKTKGRYDVSDAYWIGMCAYR